jgi:hypothetical protein
MNEFSRSISNVSQVTLGRTDASLTAEAPATGNPAFLAFVVARKGRPGVPMLVNKDNYRNVLGRPYHMRDSVLAEGFRQVGEAVEGASGYVMRVVPSDYKAPVLKIAKKVGGAQTDPNPVTPSAQAHDAALTLAADDICAIQLIDGDTDKVRKLEITPADTAQYGAGYFVLNLFEVDSNNVDVVIESHIVSFTTDTLDVNGRPAFIEDKLSTDSQRLRIKVAVNNLSFFHTKINRIAFTGGTAGTLSLVDAAAFTAAITAVKQTRISWTHIIAAGCYIDTALTAMKTLGYDTATELLADIEPNLPPATAITRAAALGFSSEYVRQYYFPYTFLDPEFGTRINCGISGIAFRAQALAVAKNAIVGAWNVPGAGEERATINRKGLQINEGVTGFDYEALYKSRINKIGNTQAGGLMIDDCLTTQPKENDLRFGWVQEVDAAIGRAFVGLAIGLKHEPQGATVEGLTRAMKRLLDNFVTAGALVTPTDPANGTTPYTFTVRKVSTDHFHCEWSICVAGAARRISGQSKLIK